jgi:hypothetical protein
MSDYLNTTAGLYAFKLYTGLYQLGRPEPEDAPEMADQWVANSSGWLIAIRSQVVQL